MIINISYIKKELIALNDSRQYNINFNQRIRGILCLLLVAISAIILQLILPQKGDATDLLKLVVSFSSGLIVFLLSDGIIKKIASPIKYIGNFIEIIIRDICKSLLVL